MTIQFGAMPHKQRMWVHRALAAESAGVLLALASVVFWKVIPHAFVLVTSAFGVVVAIALAAYVLVEYKRDPVYRKRKHLESALKHATAQVAALQASISQCARKQAETARGEASKLNARKLEHERLIADCDARRASLRAKMQDELQGSLKALREQHRARGLRASALAAARIVGVGPALKERLHRHGISTAADVDRSRLTGIAGFGPAKIDAVLSWRRDVELALERSAPGRLPSETEHTIRHRYTTLIDQIAVEEAKANSDVSEDLAAIRKAARDRQAENKTLEQSLRAKEGKTSETAQSIAAELTGFGQITLGRYLARALGLVTDRAGSLLGLAAGAFLVVSFCFQSATGGGAAAGIVFDLIPTSTPTLTATATPTSTLTPTVTFTPTWTRTPTITDTPTITPTPTKTPTTTRTSTPTRTPSSTPLPTRTRTPTATRMPTAVSPIVPSDGGGACQGASAICNDGTCSYSQHRRGTCSWHDGVREWLKALPP